MERDVHFVEEPVRVKLNCWEFRRCGREPGGSRSEELGVCPVTTDVHADGLNGGVNGGRVCWVIRNSCCDHGTGEFPSCERCEFHIRVKSEEGIWNLCNTIGMYLSRVQPAGAVLKT